MVWLSATAQASWLIDGERYHVSVHGQLSCQDCHDDVAGRRRHPQPADVNRSLMDFFKVEQCAICHEAVVEEIAEGSHAGREATRWQRLDLCLDCHDPHYQISGEIENGRALLGAPAQEKCSQCHDFQDRLPDFGAQDLACMQCHLAVSGADARTESRIDDLCLHCHSAENRQPGSFPIIDVDQYEKTPHQDVNCRVCHPQAVQFGHGRQQSGDCRQCHRPHDEKTTHDLHSTVTCGACHLDGVVPARDSGTGQVGWRRPRRADRVSPIHQMPLPQTGASCRSCHTRDNDIGASAMVLPAKSVICMPCHAATLSVGDGVSVVSLMLFLAGLIATGSVWLAGGDQTVGTARKLARLIRDLWRAVFSSRILAIVASLILDGLLQRRLFRISKERWLLHALILYPFLFRFFWGVAALIASQQWPQWPGTWAMLDKNHPLTAFLFDLSGMMVIVGVGGLMMGRVQRRTAGQLPGLPPSDWLAYSLLGGIMIAGFILEGMRIAMTGSPPGASYAFIGDAIGRLLYGFKLTGVYGYLWYLHAVLTGAFIAYLPFSRMLHMVMAPLAMAMNAASSPEAGKL